MASTNLPVRVASAPPPFRPVSGAFCSGAFYSLKRPRTDYPTAYGPKNTEAQRNTARAWRPVLKGLERYRTSAKGLRLNGIQEVVSSILIGSTNFRTITSPIRKGRRFRFWVRRSTGINRAHSPWREPRSEEECQPSGRRQYGNRILTNHLIRAHDRQVVLQCLADEHAIKWIAMVVGQR